MIRLLFLVLFLVIIESRAECPSTVYANEKELLLLSHQPATYDEAEKHCREIGGNIAYITEQERSYLWPTFRKHFLKGFSEVTVQIQRNESFITNETEATYYKYRIPGDSVFNDNITNTYETPLKGDLKSFFLYKKPAKLSTTPVFIFFTSKGDVLMNRDEFQSQEFDLELYGSNFNNKNVIKLFNYYSSSNDSFTSRLTLNPILNNSNWKQMCNWTCFVYLPDVSVFIGARYDVNQSKWFWNNGAMANNLKFSASNNHVCQQMTWPLTYDDGINLRPKECASGKADYLCSKTFSARLNEVPCNSKSLNLSWNSLERIFHGSKPNEIDLKVVLYNEKNSRNTLTFNLNLNDSSIILTDLEPGTSYYAEVEYMLSNCSGFVLQTTVSGKTANGVPSPILNTYFDNVQKKCKISFKHKSSQIEIIEYQVKISNTSKLVEEEKTIDVISDDMEVIIYLNMEDNLKYSFLTIQAVSKCGEKSSEIEVSICNTSSLEAPATPTVLSTINRTTRTREPLTSTTTARTSSEQTTNSASPITYLSDFTITNSFVTSTGFFTSSYYSTDSISCSNPSFILIGIVIGLGIAILCIAGVFAYRQYLRKQKNAMMSKIQMRDLRFRNNVSDEEAQNVANDFETPLDDVSSNENKKMNETTMDRSSLSTTNTFTSCEHPGNKKSFASNEVVQNYVDEKLNGFQTLRLQFEKIQQISLYPQASSNFGTANQNLNRYSNIYPYDHAIVPLRSGRYINAAFIEGFNNPKQFIATQGPKPNTIDDFWEMVWVQNSPVIVMLCKCEESNKTKCEMYWPSKHNNLRCSFLIISLISESVSQDLVKRTFNLTNIIQQEQRTVIQYQYLGWPDHGIPDNTTSLAKLIKLTADEFELTNCPSPMIIHCSAGVGRTGTFIAINNLIKELKETNQMDIMRAVLKMRENRTEMVQTMGQFIFVHKMVMELWLSPDTLLSSCDVSRKVENRHWLDKHSLEEFALLSHSALTTSSTADQEFTNQIVMIEDNQSFNLDAHLVQSNCCSESIIVSSQPEPDAVEMFLKMILKQNVKHVVSLEQESDCLTSQLKRGTGSIIIGTIKVDVEEVQHSRSFWTFQLLLASTSNFKVSKITYKIVKISTNQNAIKNIEIWKEMKMSMSSNKASPILLYCRDGSSKCGLFLALMMMVEQIKVEDKVDVFRTVRDLKSFRPKFFRNKEQYKQCYLVLNSYMKQKRQQLTEPIYQNY